MLGNRRFLNFGAEDIVRSGDLHCEPYSPPSLRTNVLKIFRVENFHDAPDNVYKAISGTWKKRFASQYPEAHDVECRRLVIWSSIIYLISSYGVTPLWWLSLRLVAWKPDHYLGWAPKAAVRSFLSMAQNIVKLEPSLWPQEIPVRRRV